MSAWTFEAIGTRWEVDCPASSDLNLLTENVQATIIELIDQFDRIWSRFRADSDISKIASTPGDYLLVGAEPLLNFYDALYEVTDGAVTPLIGQTLCDLGYNAQYSLRPTSAPADVADWSQIVHSGDWVSTVEPVLIDVGGAGKGRLVDLVIAALGSADVTGATVDGSGDLFHNGTEPLRVALENPHNPSKAIGVATVEPGVAMCGSATNRRTWGTGLHHVIDGRTGRPTTEVIATWVVAPESCMIADGLATAHFFAEPEALIQRWPQHSFVRVHADGRVLWSPNFPGELFI